MTPQYLGFLRKAAAPGGRHPPVTAEEDSCPCPPQVVVSQPGCGPPPGGSTGSTGCITGCRWTSQLPGLGGDLPEVPGDQGQAAEVPGGQVGQDTGPHLRRQLHQGSGLGCRSVSRQVCYQSPALRVRRESVLPEHWSSGHS